MALEKPVMATINGIVPEWLSKDFSGWEGPGDKLTANIPEDKIRRQVTSISFYRGQIVGQRNDGKFFYLNVAAHAKSDLQERAFVLGRAMLKFDDFLKEI